MPVSPEEEDETEETRNSLEGSHRTEEDMSDNEQEDSGGRKARVIVDPCEPTKKQREEHAMTHIPYQSWCPHCVRGKAREAPHKRSRDNGREVPLVAMDYTFMKMYEQSTQTPILVVKDTEFRAYSSHVVPGKGAASDWVVRRVVEDIEKLGHTDIVLKSDGEPAIKELQARSGSGENTGQY